MSAQIICVHTSKGGTGKSTITTILASYLTYELSKRVLVIDADAPQFSIDSLRHREQTIYQNIIDGVIGKERSNCTKLTIIFYLNNFSHFMALPI